VGNVAGAKQGFSRQCSCGQFVIPSEMDKIAFIVKKYQKFTFGGSTK
jgi:hypothetical protein